MFASVWVSPSLTARISWLIALDTATFSRFALPVNSVVSLSTVERMITSFEYDSRSFLILRFCLLIGLSLSKIALKN